MIINKIRFIPNAFFLSGCILFANFANANNSTGPVKIAIVGDTESFRAEMDLLTETLSSENNLVVLDRTDIDHILKEHEIVLSDISKNSIRIGKLLGADGIILLKGFNFAGKEYASARLVAVHPGTILDACIVPLNEKSEVYDLTKAVRARFLPLFVKLNISRKDAVPVSILNFRTSVPDERSADIEKDLNILISHRLMIEKNIFVNERWNMGQVKVLRA